MGGKKWLPTTGEKSAFATAHTFFGSTRGRRRVWQIIFGVWQRQRKGRGPVTSADFLHMAGSARFSFPYSLPLQPLASEPELNGASRRLHKPSRHIRLAYQNHHRCRPNTALLYLRLSLEHFNQVGCGDLERFRGGPLFIVAVAAAGACGCFWLGYVFTRTSVTRLLDIYE